MRITGERTRGQLLAYAAAAVVVAVAGFSYLRREAEPPPPPVAIEAGGSRDDGPRAAGSEAGRLYVHVAGAVRKAGLYRVPPGARVGAAIDRAGGVGPEADLSGVNLAAELQDGQQVIVPKRGEARAPVGGSAVSGTAAGSEGGSPAAPVSLSQATPEELDATVDGIGPVLAGRIIEFRDEQGSVESIDELREVDGIGDERLATLREALVP